MSYGVYSAITACTIPIHLEAKSISALLSLPTKIGSEDPIDSTLALLVSTAKGARKLKGIATPAQQVLLKQTTYYRKLFIKASKYLPIK
jgi:hypothetical protein